MSFVDIQEVSKTYGQVVAVEEVSLSIKQGEFFSILGPSGCGKTTLLRMIAGFITPLSGQIAINGRDVTGLPPEARDIGMVFQNYAIFPHMNVFDNIAFGLGIRKVNKKEIKQRVSEVLKQVDLSGYENRFQQELSGGQQQRVALARVLVIRPSILLLDEPLSALDKKMREEMKYWIKDIQQAVGITTVYVTHDQSEALTMSDRIAVMNAGKVLQIGNPQEIYEQPANRYIGEFIGESNILLAKLVKIEQNYAKLEIGSAFPYAYLNGSTNKIGDQVAVLIRPENIIIEEPSSNSQEKLYGTVIQETYQGAYIRYKILCEGQTLIAEIHNRPELKAYQKGSEVGVSWDRSSALLLDNHP